VMPAMRNVVATAASDASVALKASALRARAPASLYATRAIVPATINPYRPIPTDGNTATSTPPTTRASSVEWTASPATGSCRVGLATRVCGAPSMESWAASITVVANTPYTP